jgi:hypothetical protein
MPDPTAWGGCPYSIFLRIEQIRHATEFMHPKGTTATAPRPQPKDVLQAIQCRFDAPQYSRERTARSAMKPPRSTAH